MDIRDQSIKFDYANNIIESSGEKKWKESIDLNKIIIFLLLSEDNYILGECSIE